MAVSSEAVGAPSPGPAISPTIPAPGSRKPESSFSSALAALGERLEQGEALVERARTRDLGTLDASALIAVQAGIYRYVEAVDLASKLVDRASNAVRTVLQSHQ